MDRLSNEVSRPLGTEPLYEVTLFFSITQRHMKGTETDTKYILQSNQKKRGPQGKGLQSDSQQSLRKTK